MTAEPPLFRASTPISAQPWTRPGFRAWVAALLFALAAFGLFSRRATFPYFYHIDEPTKVGQLVTGELNFHHPLLLLKSTRSAMHLFGEPLTGQAVVEMGRKVSAAGAAIAVGALVLLAWQLGGPSAGILGGFFLVLNPLLFELAHYMKEDCVLLGGLMTCFAVLGWHSRSPSLTAAALAGLAAGLAASGKYVGFVTLAIGLIPILTTRPIRGAWKPALLFIGTALAVFAVINRDIFLTPNSAASGLGTEFVKLQNIAEENGSIFTRKYLTNLIHYIPLPLFVGTIFWIARRWKERRAQHAFTWVLIGFPIVLILAMSFFPKVKDRYVLPAMLIFGVLGAAGLVEMAFSGRFKHAALMAKVLAVGAVLWPVPDLWHRYTEFGSDDRRELIAWMREHLPADAKIAGDARTCLSKALKATDPAYQFPQTVLITDKCAADLGSLEELRSWGVHYAAVSEQNYRFFLNPKKNGKNEGLRRQRETFYKELFSTGRLLWQSPKGQLVYIHPGLRLYEF